MTSGGIGYDILIVVSEHKSFPQLDHEVSPWLLLQEGDSSMEEQSIADYNQAVSAKADIGRDSSEMYRFSGKMEYRSACNIA